MCLLYGIVAALSFILLYLVVFVNQLDTYLTEHLLSLGAVVVAAFAHHADDAAVDDEHGTGAAWGHAAIKGAAVQGDASAGGLTDGILLGMDGAHAVLGDAAVLVDGLAEQVANIVAVW